MKKNNPKDECQGKLFDALNIENTETGLSRLPIQFHGIIENEAEARCKLLLIPILDLIGISPETLKNYKYSSNEIAGFVLGEIQSLKSKIKVLEIANKKQKQREEASKQIVMGFFEMLKNGGKNE